MITIGTKVTIMSGTYNTKRFIGHVGIVKKNIQELCGCSN